MTDVHSPSGQGARTGGGIVTFIVIVLLVAVSVGTFLYRERAFRLRYAEITMEEYLKLKSGGFIKVVRVDGNDLFADIAQGGFVRGNQAYKSVHAIVPPAYLVDPKGFAELHSGLSPSQFTYTPDR
jgi:hypothetical protein